jgi:uncharacterized protein (DUF2147 family)
MNRLFKDSLVWLGFSISMALMALWPFSHVQAQTTASSSSPVGLWQSIDDATGKPRAQIRISEAAGVLTGRIIASSTATTPGVVQVCERCTDDRKNQPLIGMEMIRNMRQQGGEAAWTGGEILDPDKGSTYRLQLSLQESGKKLQVRGYVGPFFRNQTWLRLE